MMALISPQERVYDPNTGADIGSRVAQVVQDEETFWLFPPMHFAPCPDYAVADAFYADADDQVLPIPALLPAPSPAATPTVTGGPVDLG